MGPDTAREWVSTLGFPIATAIALGVVLWMVLSQLLNRHIKTLDRTESHMDQQARESEKQSRQLVIQSRELVKQTTEQKKQTRSLRRVEERMADICQANCPKSTECENFRPKSPGEPA